MIIKTSFTILFFALSTALGAAQQKLTEAQIHAGTQKTKTIKKLNNVIPISVLQQLIISYLGFEPHQELCEGYSSANCASCSPSGLYLAVVTSYSIIIWQLKQNKYALFQKIEYDGMLARDVAFSPNDQYLAAVNHEERPIQIYSLKNDQSSYELLQELDHGDHFMAVSFSKKYIATASSYGEIQVSQLIDGIFKNKQIIGKRLGAFPLLPPVYITALPDDESLAAIFKSGKIELFKRDGNKFVSDHVCQLPGETYFNKAKVSQDGTLAAQIKSKTCLIQIAHLINGKYTQQACSLPEQDICTKLTVSANGKYIASINDRDITIWHQINKQYQAFQTINNLEYLHFAIFSPDNKYLISCKVAVKVFKNQAIELEQDQTE